MANRTIIFVYSEFQNQKLTTEILNILDQYELGIHTIQVDSPESRNIIKDKVKKVPTFVVKTGQTRNYYSSSKALDFITAVVNRYPDRKIHSSQEEDEKFQEPEEESLQEEFLQEELEELTEEQEEPPEEPKIKKFSKPAKPEKKVKKKKPAPRRSRIIEEIESEDTNNYFPSSEDEDHTSLSEVKEENTYEPISDDDAISVIYNSEDDEDLTPSIKPSPVMEMAKRMAEARKDIRKNQFPGLEETE